MRENEVFLIFSDISEFIWGDKTFHDLRNPENGSSWNKKFAFKFIYVIMLQSYHMDYDVWIKKVMQMYLFMIIDVKKSFFQWKNCQLKKGQYFKKSKMILYATIAGIQIYLHAICE